jgi:hypothetical protein
MSKVTKNVTTSVALREPTKTVTTKDEKLAIRKAIEDAENKIRRSALMTKEQPHSDHFADGLYARELFMPAGLIITSKIHKTNHFAFVLKGKAAVLDENSGIQIIEAPCMIKTLAGTKRALHVLEDSLWVTVHATEETDVDKIEKQIISERHLDELIEDKGEA